jgi:hypothetical protein
MKNIYLLPTDKPSRLHFWTVGKGPKLELCELEYSHTRNTQHIYITSDEEIKEGDWVYHCASNKLFKYDGRGLCVEVEKIILTTDQDLINDGVQAIDDEFLEWFVKNPSCEKVKVIYWEGYSDIGLFNYEIIIPQEKPKIVTVNAESATGEYLATVSYIPLPHLDYIPKQETLEEAAERLSKDNLVTPYEKPSFKNGFIEGAQWQAERMYTEAIEFAEWIRIKDFQTASKDNWIGLDMKYYTTQELFEQFKKK